MSTSKSPVEAGTVVIFPRWEVNIESDGFEDWWCFEEAYVHGELVPAENLKECTILQVGESAIILDEYLGYCRVVNENGKAVFRHENGVKMFDADGNDLDEQGRRVYDDEGCFVDYDKLQSN